MQTIKKHLNNEAGVSLIPTLIVLSIATIIGIAASTTSIFEMKVATNERLYKQNFTRADGANQLGSRLIDNSSEADLQNRSPDWLALFDQSIDHLDLGNWCTPSMVSDGDCSAGDENAGDVSNIDNTRFMVLDHGGAPGAEISMGSPYMHAMGVYGRYDNNTPRGRVIVETEYRIRF